MARTKKTNPLKKNTKIVLAKKSPRPAVYRPLSRALLDICRFQKSTELLVPQLPFMRSIKEAMQDVCAKDGLNGGVPMRMTGKAVEALQWAGEDFVSDVFKDAMNCSIFAKRLNLQLEGLIFAIHHIGNKDTVLREWKQLPREDKSAGTEAKLI